MLIAHLSVPHLRPPGQLYQGLVDSNAMFAAALRHLASLTPSPDARHLLAAVPQPWC